MIFLRYGDRLPAVAVVQRLINECRSAGIGLAGGDALVEDGVFGRHTRNAVKAVQRALSVHPDSGIFGPLTWRAVATQRKCKIVDVSDLVLETKFNKFGERKVREIFKGFYTKKHPGKSSGEVARMVDDKIRKIREEIKTCRDQHNRCISNGGEPIGLTYADITHPFDAIRRGLAARSRDGSRVVLLRFTGHGAPGRQGVAGTAHVRDRIFIDKDMLSFDDDDTAAELVQAVMVGGMTMPMARFGVVELHGCSVAARRHVGRGKNRVLVNGAAYIQTFANVVGRPVSSSTRGDYVGSVKLDVRFEGPVVSCVPGGGTIKKWFRQR